MGCVLQVTRKISEEVAFKTHHKEEAAAICRKREVMANLRWPLQRPPGGQELVVFQEMKDQCGWKGREEECGMNMLCWMELGNYWYSDSCRLRLVWN